MQKWLPIIRNNCLIYANYRQPFLHKIIFAQLLLIVSQERVCQQQIREEEEEEAEEEGEGGGGRGEEQEEQEKQNGRHLKIPKILETNTTL